jgi:thiaminase/transcriptional activator TenA
MSVSDTLKSSSSALWRGASEHPFVDELGAGTLPREKFRRYLIQDYIFVRDLVKVSALAIAKAPDMEGAREMGRFLSVLLGAEDAFFIRAFRSLRVPEQEWRNAEPRPPAAAFGDCLVRLAYAGSFRDICTALLVTEGAYLEWAERLRRRGAKPAVKTYREWMDIHTEKALGPMVRFLCSVVDGAPPTEVRHLQAIFDQVCRFEAGFWDMAYA